MLVGGRLLPWSLCCLLSVAGCARFGAPRPLSFRVGSSGLDIVEVLYLPAPDHPDIQAPSRLVLFGSGRIKLVSGTSPRVVDGFSIALEDPRWDDYRESAVNLSMTEMTALFQRLVNAGLVYPLRKPPKPPPGHDLPVVRAAGKIGGNSFNRVVFEDDLVFLFEHIITSVR